jgi:hypothetical protein
MTFLTRCFYGGYKLHPMCLAESICFETGTALEDLNPSLREYTCTCSRQCASNRRGEGKEQNHPGSKQQQGLQQDPIIVSDSSSTPSNPPEQNLFDVAYGVVFKTWEKDQYIQQVMREWDENERFLASVEWYRKPEILAAFYKTRGLIIGYLHKTPDPVTELKDMVVDISATAEAGHLCCQPDPCHCDYKSTRWRRMRLQRCDCCSCRLGRSRSSSSL